MVNDKVGGLKFTDKKFLKANMEGVSRSSRATMSCGSTFHLGLAADYAIIPLQWWSAGRVP